MWQPFPDLALPESNFEWSAVRAQGAGGQNVNKVSSAAQLRFSIPKADLPDMVKERLLATGDRRISREGVLVIKAQRFRDLEKNKLDALQRLKILLEDARKIPLARKATKPSRAARQKRLNNKAHRAKTKNLRTSVDD